MICHLENDVPVICQTLSDAINGTTLRGQLVVNMKTGEACQEIIVLRTGKFKKRGIVLNFCPFCAGPVLSKELKERIENQPSESRQGKH